MALGFRGQNNYDDSGNYTDPAGNAYGRPQLDPATGQWWVNADQRQMFVPPPPDAPAWQPPPPLQVGQRGYIEQLLGLTGTSPHTDVRKNLSLYTFTPQVRQALDAEQMQRQRQGDRGLLSDVGGWPVKRDQQGQWQYIVPQLTQGGSRINPATGDIHYYPTQSGSFIPGAPEWTNILVGGGAVIGAGLGGAALAPALAGAEAGAVSGAAAGGVTAAEAAGLAGEGALWGAAPTAGAAGGLGAGGLGGAGSLAALAPEFEGGTFGATGASTFLSPSVSGSSLLGGASPYVTGGSYGLKGLGAATGNENLSRAGSALGMLGAAGGVGGGMAGGDWGSVGDWGQLIGLGAGIGNAVYGGVQAKGAQNRANEATDVQAQIARQLFDQAQPLMLANMGQLGRFSQTGQLPVGLNLGLDALRTTGREGLEAQYNVARQNILNQTPRGGQQVAALNNLEQARAGAIGRLGADILGQYDLPLRQNVFQMGVNTGLGQATTGLNALGTSANNFMNMANIASQQAGAGGAAAGGLLALMLRNQGANTNPLTGTQFSNPMSPAQLAMAKETPWYAQQSPFGGASYT